MVNQIIQNSLLTVAERIEFANDLIQDWSSSNTFLGIGGESPYQANDQLVPVPNQSVSYLNSIWRTLISLKKITAADLAFVVPRIDWQSGVTYSQYDDQVDMFATVRFQTSNGTVNVSNSRTLTGTNTAFLTQFSSGELVMLPGDGEIVGPQIRQIIDIFSNTSMNVNSTFIGNFVSNSIFLVNETTPDYANQFYARNQFDQVFVCLFNNGGIPSTQMPQISIGGDLPEDASIITSDGYQWKYMYTIPPGQKQLFFSPDWMPVFKDPTVVSSAVSGRIDVILIENGGSGYNGNVPSNSATILTVTGDGSGANVTAVVNANGSITGLNILNGGENYTTAQIIVNAGPTGNGAILRPIISPKGGHGFNPVEEMGATNLLLSVELAAGENGTIPTGASIGSSTFEYRQISIIKEPLLSSSGTQASNVNYSVVTTINTQPPPAGSFFSIDETVYQGISLATATFTATVVFWDDVNNVLWLNNVNGEFNPQSPIIGTEQTTPITAFIDTPPVIELFSGLVLYVNNVLPVIRGVDQTEQVRLILSF